MMKCLTLIPLALATIVGLTTAVPAASCAPVHNVPGFLRRDLCSYCECNKPCKPECKQEQYDLDECDCQLLGCAQGGYKRAGYVRALDACCASGSFKREVEARSDGALDTAHDESKDSYEGIPHAAPHGGAMDKYGQVHMNDHGGKDPSEPTASTPTTKPAPGTPQYTAWIIDEMNPKVAPTSEVDFKRLEGMYNVTHMDHTGHKPPSDDEGEVSILPYLGRRLRRNMNSRWLRDSLIVRRITRHATMTASKTRSASQTVGVTT